MKTRNGIRARPAGTEIKVTGKKMSQKTYFSHSEYIGGTKIINLQEMLEKHPERVVEHAVKGMLPKGALGNQMYKKLFVYAGPEHPHKAQQPVELNF